MKPLKALYILLTVSLIAVGCKEQTLSSDPSLTLSFSADSLSFDTVFTETGSSTQLLMVYNRNKNAVKISHITWKSNFFQINLDGENDRSRLHDITINGKDSLYMFVRVYIPQQTENTPVLIADTMRFYVNGNEQTIPMQAYGQNVTLIKSDKRHQTFLGNYVFTNQKPYLIIDTLEITGKAIVQEGVNIYMHSSASLLLRGGIAARGTSEKPIRITSDRLDRLFAQVPYQNASGGWGGIYLLQGKNDTPHQDTLNYTEILSGNVGLYCYAETSDKMPHLTLSNSRIHNHATYGVILQNTDADIWNTEISNCASYCLYIDGGKHNLTHNTIASFFGWPYTNINIHNVLREDVAAVYINNLSKQHAATEVNMCNCIVTGARDNNLVLATPLADYYTGHFTGNYLRSDSLKAEWSKDNVYAGENDTVFRNTYYLYKEYVYYDFRLDSVSPARGIGVEIASDMPYSTDRAGIKRTGKRPDAGCYEWQE